MVIIQNYDGSGDKKLALSTKEEEQTAEAAAITELWIREIPRL